jgi:long-chain fatty acid transport protein
MTWFIPLLRVLACSFAMLSILAAAVPAAAQSFGVESHNTLMPASGGMAGASISRPQDLLSGINANPATLTQFSGTQFLFGGAWAEPTFNMTQTAPIPLLGVDPFSGKSTAQGVAAGNIGVTQSLEMMGLPVVFGLGFISNAAGGADFRHIPQSNSTNSALMVLEMASSASVQLTERLSAGTTLFVGTGLFDGPFVEIGGMTSDYALRASLGLNYQLTDSTSVGAYYQSEQSFRFDNAVQFAAGPILDVNMDLPQNVGLGIANTTLMDGKLLLAADVLYKNWDNAQLFSAVYRDQWVMQLGAQYSLGNYRLRTGYAYAENPIDSTPINNIGGVFPPGGPPSVRYTQGLLAVTSQHRVSCGIGAVDVLPGLDMDLLAGGMFRDSEQLGPSTSTSIASYWIGFGLTWRFGACPQSYTMSPSEVTGFTAQ